MGLKLDLLLIGVLVVMAGIGFSIAELQKFEHSAKADGSLSLLVVGDWGRKGNYNQSLVARQVIYYIVFCCLRFLFIYF